MGQSSRREFIKATALTTGALGLGLSGCGQQTDTGAGEAQSSPGSAKLNLLILGGTGFIGPHMVEYARAQGHQVTLFNRGRTNADRFPDVETLIGDRDGNLDALVGRHWDAVIDNSGYVPRHVADSAGLLAEAADQYLFISTISTYADFKVANIDESYSLAKMEDETIEEVTGETYGPLKALCEEAVQGAFGDRATIVRPGYIVGPGDRSDRWTYWPVRVAAGGRMLAPGGPSDPVQVIDARDLARFTVSLLERSVNGTFNAVGPETPIEMGDMLDVMKTATGSDAEFVWVGAETLQEKNAMVPIWNAPTGDFTGVHQMSNARALSAGMTYRPMAETVEDTLAWWNDLDDERRAAMRSGLRVLDGPPEGFQMTPLAMNEQMSLEAELLKGLDAPA